MSGLLAVLQVASVLTLGPRGALTAQVRNPSGEAMKVTVELKHASQVGSVVTLGDEVEALLSPRGFTLGPREQQAVRIRVRKPLPRGTVLRLVTTFTPITSDKSAPGSETLAVARLVFQTRLITKVVAP